MKKQYKDIEVFIDDLNEISDGFVVRVEAGTIELCRWSTAMCKRLLKKIKEAGYKCTLNHITLTVVLKENKKTGLYRK